MNTGKVLLSILAGVAAGALLGVLFAPDKGSNTRKKISSKSSDYADALKEKFNGFIESVSENYEKVKEEVTEFIVHEKAKMKEMPTDGKKLVV